jgi:hypothetical protein
MGEVAVRQRIFIGVAAVALFIGLGYGVGRYLWPPPPSPDLPPGPAGEPPPEHPLAAPPLRYQKVEWDFGTSPPGAEKKRSYEITNTAAETWTLKHLKATCSCASAELPAKTIPPGETARLEITYRAPHQDGKVSGTLMVEFAERTSPIIQMTIQGEVRALLAADPPSVVFDYAPPGTRPSHTVTLHNRSDRRVAITRVEAPAWLQTELRPRNGTDKEDRPKQEWELVVHADPEKLPPGSGSATLRVRTDSDEVGSVYIDVSFKGPLEVSPERLAFDTAESRKNGLKVAVRVAPALGELTDKDLVVTHDLGDELDVQVRKESPQLFVLVVRLQAKPALVPVAGELEIKLLKGTAPPVRVKVTGNAAGP